MHGAQFVEGRDHAMAQGDVGLQQAADEGLLRLGRADANQHGRQLAARIDRRILVAQTPFDLGHQRVAVRRQRGRHVVGQLIAPEDVEQRFDQLVAGHRARRSNRLACHGLVGILNQASEHVEEGVGDEGNQPRRLGPLARAGFARRRHHRVDQRARGLEVLRRPRRRQERRHPGTDREVLEIAELLNLCQRIDAHLPRQVEERFGADTKIGILAAARRSVGDLAIAGRSQQRERAAPDVGLGIRQQHAAAMAPSSSSAAPRGGSSA